jgi:hypothetical protein
LATSACYGNRLAEHHEARDGSERRSYKHDLGRMPTDGSNATFHWGHQYWAFMARAYRAMRNVVREDGLVLVNVSDFVRNMKVVPAVAWHAGALWGAGFVADQQPVAVGTPRLRYGANYEARADHEVILVFRQREEIAPR